MLNPSEAHIFTKALQAFQMVAGLELVWDKTLSAGNAADAVIRVHGQTLVAEVKRNIRPAHLGAIIQHIKTLRPSGLLIADYINPSIAKILKENDVSYLDMCGNAYLNLPPILILIVGQKTQIKIKSPGNKAFDIGGLKLIYNFLCDRDLVTSSYRTMAEQANIALGSVGSILSGLEDAGYLIDRGKADDRILINGRKLLNRWAEAYAEKLKPKLHIGEFISADADWWKPIDLTQFDAYWGGEMGAAHYTSYLKPQDATVYVPDTSAKKFLAAAKLKKATGDHTGTIHIYQPFWTDKLQNKLPALLPDTVHPILIYADLVASLDSRNLETAKVFYDSAIAKYFRED